MVVEVVTTLGEEEGAVVADLEEVTAQEVIVGTKRLTAMAMVEPKVTTTIHLHHPNLHVSQMVPVLMALQTLEEILIKTKS